MSSLETLLEQLENAQLVRREPDADLSYLFKHGLTQESAYEALLLKRRREIHRLVAEALETLYPDRVDEFASLLAHHFAEAGNHEKTVEYAIRAGDRSGRLSAGPEAGAYYALALQALARLPDTPGNRRRRFDVMIKRTAVYAFIASPEEGLAQLGEAQSLIEALLGTNSPSPEDRLRLARLQAWEARMHFFRQERREALQDFMQVLPIAHELNDEELSALAVNMIARIRLWGGAFDQALPLLQQTLPALEQKQNWIEWVLNDSLVAVVLAAQGDSHAGVVEAGRALAQARDMNHSNGMAVSYGTLALVHLMGGATRPMLEASRAGLQIAIPEGTMIPGYFAWATRAWAESRLGRHPAARTSMAQAEAIARESGRHLFLDDWLAAIKIEMALNEGRFEDLLAQVEEAVAFVRSVAGKFAEGLVQRSWGWALASLNPPEFEEAETHLTHSLDLLASGGAVLEATRTRVALGRVMQAQGNKEGAREQFERAARQLKVSGLESELEGTKRLIANPP